MIADTNNIYACCDLFILFGADIILTKIHFDFISAIEAAIIVKNNLDCCRYIDIGSYFCKFCYVIVIEKKISKFGSANCINVSSYQKYSNVFNNLIAIEKAIIAYTYPIMLIIKLRSGDFSFFVLYY